MSEMKDWLNREINCICARLDHDSFMSYSARQRLHRKLEDLLQKKTNIENTLDLKDEISDADKSKVPNSDS